MRVCDILLFIGKKVCIKRVVVRGSGSNVLFDGDSYEASCSTYYALRLESFTCDVEYVDNEHYATVFVDLNL